MLENSKLKIANAQRHIDLFGVEERSYLDRDPYEFTIETDPNTKEKLLVFWIREPIPPIFSAIIGDAIHNLRSALDLLSVEIVSRMGGKTDNVYFPFTRDAATLESTINSRQINQAGDEIVNIFKKLRPYKGGDDELRAIHDLDIKDKHITIIPVNYINRLPNMHIQSGMGSSAFVENIIGPMVDRQIVRRFHPDSIIYMSKPAPTEFSLFQENMLIMFGPDQPVRGVVSVVLNKFALKVTEIVDRFEKYFGDLESAKGL